MYRNERQPVYQFSTFLVKKKKVESMTNQSLGSPSAHVILNLAVFQATCYLLTEATAVKPDHAGDTGFTYYTTRIGLSQYLVR